MIGPAMMQAGDNFFWGSITTLGGGSVHYIKPTKNHGMGQILSLFGNARILKAPVIPLAGLSSLD